MAQYVFTMNKVSKIVPPKRQILKDISLSFFPGAKIGVLGLNGSGKSTLLKIMAALDTDIQGEARPMPGIKIGYLAQEPLLDPEKNVRGNVEDGMREAVDALKDLDQVYLDYAEPDADFDALAKKQGDLEAIIESWDAHNLDHALDIAADALRLPPWDADVTSLSGGEKRRVALCRLLLSRPDMLLLDEPTNHLDAESIGWLQKHLMDYAGTILVVTHDRYFLDDITSWILEIDRGQGVPYEGNYSSWLGQKAKRLSLEAREDKSKQKTLERELDWMRQGQKARQAKSKARIAAYNDMANQSEREKVGHAQIIIPNGPRLGSKVIEVESLKKAMGDKLLVEGLSFSLPPGGIVGVIGPNGAGKTTLFKMLTGQEQPDEGTVEFGDTVQLSYVDQSRIL